MKLRTLGERYIRPSLGHETIVSENATVADIIKSIMLADCQDSYTVERFAPFLKKGNDYDTLRNVWSFTRKNIRYVRDNQKDRNRQHIEAVKSPAATWRDKYADCKGMSLLNGAIVKHLGYPYRYRVAFYDPEEPNQGHIYPVVTLPDGSEVIVDSVSSEFDCEEPFWKASDYYPKCEVKIEGFSPANKHNKLLDGLLVALFFIIAIR